ncbi:hypothetical protein ACO1O0_005887 [Amphichorda felina]
MLQTILTLRHSPFKARAISAFYIWSAKIIYQVIAFFVGIGAVACRVVCLFFWARLAPPRDMALGICLLGYAIWNVDAELCAALGGLKERAGRPWAWLLELYGWWHILTAIGADRFMAVAREMREEALQEEGEKRV